MLNVVVTSEVGILFFSKINFPNCFFFVMEKSFTLQGHVQFRIQSVPLKVSLE